MPRLPTSEEIDKLRQENYEKYKNFLPLLWKNMPLYPTRYEKRAEKGLPQNDYVFGFIDPDNHATYGWSTLTDLVGLLRKPLTYKRIMRILDLPCIRVFDQAKAAEFRKQIEKEFNKEYDYSKKKKRKMSRRDAPKQLTLSLQSGKPSELPFDTNSNQAASMVWDDDDDDFSQW